MVLLIFNGNLIDTTPLLAEQSMFIHTLTLAVCVPVNPAGAFLDRSLRRAETFKIYLIFLTYHESSKIVVHQLHTVTMSLMSLQNCLSPIIAVHQAAAGDLCFALFQRQ